MTGVRTRDPRDPSATPPSRRAWIVWGAGLFVYLIDVLNRTSLSVAGVDAAERFAAPVGFISTFVVVQLLVYALMQVPAGVLLDRIGPRMVITAGALCAATGQLLMALSTSLANGLAARVILGLGDAVIFVSAIRVIPSWFESRRVPLLTQLTGMVGQLGQVLSAVPMMAVLHRWGWSTAFLGVAATTALSALVGVLLIRDTPDGRARPRTADEPDSLIGQVGDVWGHPGTRLGAWTHWTTAFAGMVFGLYWGYPFMTRGEGVSPPMASALITLFVLAGIAFGPVMGVLTHRYPLRRSAMALTTVLGMALTWSAVLLWPGPAPLWLLALLVVSVAASGPGSMIGFDFARTMVPEHRLGTATGVVIMAGFTAALLDILLIGLVLDHVGGPNPDRQAFRLAMAMQAPFWILGVVMVLRSRAVAREHTGVAPADSLPHAMWRKLN